MIEGSTSWSETNAPGGACLTTSALAGVASRRRKRIVSRRNEAAGTRLPGGVRDPAPVGLGGQLDRLVVALGLDVAERVRGLVEGDVELALLHALVEPGGAEHEAAEPVHERALRGADELRPAVVDVLAERRRRVGHLPVDGQVHEVLELDALEP